MIWFIKRLVGEQKRIESLEHDYSSEVQAKELAIEKIKKLEFEVSVFRKEQPHVDAIFKKLVELESENNALGEDFGKANREILRLESENKELLEWKEGKKGIEDYYELKTENARLRGALKEIVDEDTSQTEHWHIAKKALGQGKLK